VSAPQCGRRRRVPRPGPRGAIREALESPRSLRVSDLLVLQNLTATSRGIANLAGLERCVNLRSLNLQTNSITDLGPLRGLTNLVVLQLTQNEIRDVGPLAGLTGLVLLSLLANHVTDIAPLASLTTWTRSSWNEISDRLLPGSSVRVLYADGNGSWTWGRSRDDRSSSSTSAGQIVDLAALVANPGIGSGDEPGRHNPPRRARGPDSVLESRG
jgi:hypothetical protein